MSASEVMITGSSGFIGTNLCSSLMAKREGEMPFSGLDLVHAAPAAPYREFIADICNPGALESVSSAFRPKAILHLAAKAEVVLPWATYPDTMQTNVSGTLNVLNAFNPRTFIFTSTSSVYGHTGRKAAPAVWSGVNPLSVYGMSKSLGELICRDWARETGNAAVVFRLANVIGTGCRGLIQYLVNHALRFPDGAVTAELRGEGQLIRDYVPVSHVAEVMTAALRKDFGAGTFSIFNIGTGRGMTNREVAGIVIRILEQKGYCVRTNWSNPVGHGEAMTAVLHPSRTFRTFGIQVPDRDTVIAAIEAAACSLLPEVENR